MNSKNIDSQKTYVYSDNIKVYAKSKEIKKYLKTKNASIVSCFTIFEASSKIFVPYETRFNLTYSTVLLYVKNMNEPFYYIGSWEWYQAKFYVSEKILYLVKAEQEYADAVSWMKESFVYNKKELIDINIFTKGIKERESYV